MIIKNFIFNDKKCKLLLDKSEFLEGEVFQIGITGIKNEELNISIVNSEKVELLKITPYKNSSNLIIINQKLLFCIESRYNLTNKVFINIKSKTQDVTIDLPINLYLSNMETNLINELNKLKFFNEGDYYIYIPNKNINIFKNDERINYIKLYYLINNSFIYLYIQVSLKDDKNRVYNKNFIHKKNSILNEINKYLEKI